MKKLIISAAILFLVGCATPAQNAALIGAVVGATIVSASHPHHHHHNTYSYYPRCTYVRGAYAGRDVYGNPMFQYRYVCPN